MIELKLGAKNDFVGILETVSLWLNVYCNCPWSTIKGKYRFKKNLAKVPQQLCYAKLLEYLKNLVCEISLLFDCLVIRIKKV